MISNPFKGFKKDYYPKGNKTQGFGENPELYVAAMGLKSHNGEDYVAPWGTPLYAVEDGLIVETKTDPSGYGMHLRFITENEGIKREWTYGHLSKILVNPGDKIRVGQQIALMGNTGFVVSSTNQNALGYWDRGGNNYMGTHLHLGCREWKTRAAWTYSTGIKGVNVLNYDNGWNGCIDFKDMFYKDSIMGDMEILKRELEKTPEDEWWMKLIKALKFFQ